MTYCECGQIVLNGTNHPECAWCDKHNEQMFYCGCVA